MAEDKSLKSAYELAMERLRKQDEQSGVEQRRPTDAQKAAMAEVRNFYEAKMAELDVLQQSRLRRTFDPAERETIETDLRRDRERLVSERDAKIEKIRRGEQP
ncbi:MAG: hypothetical protein A3I61_06970 [Acidobacteria bacterium RIFCSPLOWO2_02_FULL_68_18]|nr:MAG: hypothetical protein A3I61_06970 [Acidobacteria bacterium RIFCSPLOWO2_02_FULL_68_18]OFW48332.1 MAG: hypothetical protein A3G77_03555 [Acidobacteria bacterium RIFCSPLOWO2_12_FULL_68_19]